MHPNLPLKIELKFSVFYIIKPKLNWTEIFASVQSIWSDLFGSLVFLHTPNLYNHWSSFGYLSYQSFAGGDRMCCKLWMYYLGGYFIINAASWVIAIHWMRRWWVLYLDISLLLYLHISTSFLDILSFGPSGLLKASRATFALCAPRAICFFDFNTQTLINILDQD